MPDTRDQLDTIDRKLLDLLQQQVPLIPRPFDELARRLGIEEIDALARLGAISFIRQISAIFDSTALGYRSCLVAARVDESNLERAAAVVSEHPGVSHNYRRDHIYNLWFTLAVPPDSALGLERTIDILRAQSGADAMRMLPSIRMYKIGVKFDLSGESDSPPPVNSSMRTSARQSEFVPGESDKRVIRALQKNLPLVPRPFQVLARQEDVEEAELLAAARDYLERGIMRRFAAVLKHRQAGFGANAMGVWAVADQQADEFGAIAAGFDAVSHCYRRPTYPDWPYSVFTMVHGTSREQCESVLSEIASRTGVRDRAVLYSSREFKKIRLKYFTPEIAAWESSAATIGAAS